MVKRRLSDVLDEITENKSPTFWHAKLLELQALVKEKKYMALELRISDLLESDRATGKIKPSK